MAGTCTGTINVTIPCTPSWQCEPGQTGYETDGCGNRRENPACVTAIKYGSLSFTSIPQGAEIYLAPVGHPVDQCVKTPTAQCVKTPATITNLPVETYTYILKMEGFNDYEGTVAVLENQTVTVPTTPLAPNEGCIYLNILPAGAKIIVDNTDTGRFTPDLVCGLSLDSHTYSLELTGYQPVTGTVDIGAGYGKTVTATMVETKKGMGAGTILGITVGLVGIGLYMTSKEKEQPPIRTRLKS